MNPPQTPVPVGYGAVASCMNCDRDLALYRRFGALNSRNLLYMQSELMSMETRLQELDAEANDISKGNETWSVPRSWYYLEKARGEHWEVVMKIREKLEAYKTVKRERVKPMCVGDTNWTKMKILPPDADHALASHAWLLSLKKPAHRPMMNLIGYLRANHREMSQTDAEFIAEKHRADIVALSCQEKELMSLFLERHFSWMFGLFAIQESPIVRSENGGQMGLYSDGKIRNFVRLLAVIGSSVLPILSTVVLYLIPSLGARLGCIVAFSLLCSATLATLSDAKNGEIIAATAAYAGVQVVFISNTISA
ncbi:MAG: hypothetical protein MMC33_005190 [Icmadophila ericetorum]|nr:hypothetical protein [Icmadophila ericetorum]